MAAKFLGLFFLIIGTAGISDAFSLKDFFQRSKRSYPIWLDDSFRLNSFKGRSDAPCRYKYGPFACRYIAYDPPYFKLETDHNAKTYPVWQNPYFRHRFGEKQSFENPFYNDIYDFYDPTEESQENMNEHDDNVESHVNNEVKVSEYIRASTLSPSSVNPIQSNAYSKSNTPSPSSDGSNFAQDFFATYKPLSNVKFSSESIKDNRVTDSTSNPRNLQMIHRTPVERQQRFSSFTEKENMDLIKVKNTFSPLENSSQRDTIEPFVNNEDTGSTSEHLTNNFRKNGETGSSFVGKREGRIYELTFPVTSYLTTPETKRFSPVKESSFQERMNKPLEENLRTETRLNQGYTEIHSVINTEVTPSADKSSSSDSTEIIQNRNSVDKESKLEPTASESSSSIITDEENSLKMKSKSPERTYSVSTQNLYTESDTSHFDSTASQFKSSHSFETQSTSAEISEIDTTTENSILSNKFSSISFTDKVKDYIIKDTFLTESPSLKIRFTQGAIPQDHIIEISSIRTARIVVTTIFLVIALTALTVLAVYMCRLRRKEVQYDQLMLIT